MSHAYDKLTPDCVVNAVEAVGLLSDARIYPLNSYENRVYQVGIEEGAPVIVKFYRPGRWTNEAIEAEHSFTCKLAENEIPVVEPQVHNGKTLHEFEGFRYALYRKQPGHWPELDDPEVMEWIGRFIGRIHAVGRTMKLESRQVLSPQIAKTAADYLIQSEWLPSYIADEYKKVTTQLISQIEEKFEACSAMSFPIHGDCHPGNILWYDGPHFVDLDDCVSGPAIQDIWMLLSGERKERSLQLSDFIEGYEMFSDFDRRELIMIESLRAIRLIHYASWLAKRWVDPAFPAAFPWFEGNGYWEEHVNTLKQQCDAMAEPVLKI